MTCTVQSQLDLEALLQYIRKRRNVVTCAVEIYEYVKNVRAQQKDTFQVQLWCHEVPAVPGTLRPYYRGQLLQSLTLPTPDP